MYKIYAYSKLYVYMNNVFLVNMKIYETVCMK